MGQDRVPVLLFDGECALCNAVVRFMLRRDRSRTLRFAALQSRPAQDYLRAQGLPTEEFSSLVFVPDWTAAAKGAYLLRTDGVIAALCEMGGPWRSARWLRVVPSPVRNAAYTIIARTRRVLFGAYTPRPLPDPSWQGRFIGG